MNGLYSSVCEDCGEPDFAPNIEAFELFDALLCGECAETRFESEARRNTQNV